MRSIALLTDFGTRDPYVAAMKGVLASRTAVPLHDLTHDVAPYDVLGAAWFLGTVVRYWPAGTIFVCIVDPGVGTTRRIVAVEREGRVFLAPDNGLLTFVAGGAAAASAADERTRSTRRPERPPLHRDDAGRAFSVENDALFLPGGSNTFHGRDRFAPVAAALANGLALEEVGPRVDDLTLLSYTPPTYEETAVHGTVVAVDRFGNVITDVDAARIPFAPFALTVNDIHLDRVEQNYGDAAPGPFLITGSTGCIEISIANASAAERLHLRRLQRVAIIPA